MKDEIIEEWEMAYSEDFIMDGPISIEVLLKHPELEDIMEDMDNSETEDEYDDLADSFYSKLAKSDIDVISIIRDYITPPNETGYQYDGDIEMQQWLDAHYPVMEIIQ